MRSLLRAGVGIENRGQTMVSDENGFAITEKATEVSACATACYPPARRLAIIDKTYCAAAGTPNKLFSSVIIFFAINANVCVPPSIFAIKLNDGLVCHAFAVGAIRIIALKMSALSHRI